MTIEIKVPDLTESVSEANVGKWLKKVGDFVEAGENVLDVETDKVNLEITAPKSGVLVSISKNPGDIVKMGEVLGLLDDSKVADNQTKTPTTKKPSTPLSEVLADKPIDHLADVTPHAQTEEQVASVQNQTDDIDVTPTARRLAEQKKIDISTVSGTGIAGKVTKSDVEFAIAEREVYSSDKPTTPAIEEQIATNKEEIIHLSRRRRTIAERMLQAQNEAVMTTTYNEIDMRAVVKIRQSYREQFLDKYGVKLGLTSFFMKATIAALKDFPHLNAELKGSDELVIKHYYNVGIAVASDEGLVVPIIRNADKKSFADIEHDVALLSRKVRSGKIELKDIQGGTFTITNGGVFGSLFSTPILNPGQVGVLGLHAIKERPIAVNNKIEIGPMMFVALTYDHRIVDGSMAVRFLSQIKRLIEDPYLLVIDF